MNKELTKLIIYPSVPGVYWKVIHTYTNLPPETGRKSNVHKTFRRCPGRLLNALCTFNLRLMYKEQLSAAGLFKYEWPFSGHQALKS